jgi:hypothetical protein
MGELYNMLARRQPGLRAIVPNTGILVPILALGLIFKTDCSHIAQGFGHPGRVAVMMGSVPGEIPIAIAMSYRQSHTLP